MSRNNVIVVAIVGKPTRKYYAFSDLNADTEWSEDHVRKLIDSNEYKFTYDRGKALIRAHNLQQSIDTEYGVRELYL